MTMSLTAIFQQEPEGYKAFVEKLPGANSRVAPLGAGNWQKPPDSVTI